LRSQQNISVTDGCNKVRITKQLLPRRRFIVARNQNFGSSVRNDCNDAVIVEIRPSAVLGEESLEQNTTVDRRFKRILPMKHGRIVAGADFQVPFDDRWSLRLIGSSNFLSR